MLPINNPTAPGTQIRGLVTFTDAIRDEAMLIVEHP